MKLFTDHASGARQDRPGLTQALAALQPGDILVVWRLDRLGRSLNHLLTVVDTLKARNVGFRSLQEAMDTTTPGGTLTFHIFGALAEFERALIRERTQAGLAAARSRGRVGGRRDKLTPDQIDMARQLLTTRSAAEVAEATPRRPPDARRLSPPRELSSTRFTNGCSDLPPAAVTAAEAGPYVSHPLQQLGVDRSVFTDHALQTRPGMIPGGCRGG